MIIYGFFQSLRSREESLFSSVYEKGKNLQSNFDFGVFIDRSGLPLTLHPPNFVAEKKIKASSAQKLQ